MADVTCYCWQLKGTHPTKNAPYGTATPPAARLPHKPLFDNVKVASKQIKKHIEIGLMCSRQLVLLLLLLLVVGCCRIAKDIALPVYFTGYNPKIKRGLSIKICAPGSRGLPIIIITIIIIIIVDCCFKIKLHVRWKNTKRVREQLLVYTGGVGIGNG